MRRVSLCYSIDKTPSKTSFADPGFQSSWSKPVYTISSSLFSEAGSDQDTWDKGDTFYGHYLKNSPMPDLTRTALVLGKKNYKAGTNRNAIHNRTTSHRDPPILHDL